MSHDVPALAVRRATAADLPAAARMGAELARQHHRYDAKRFMDIASPEEGYLWWFQREIRRHGAVILVAARGETIVGYAYGTLEERDWNALRDPCGALNDVYVDATARSHGVGRKLVEQMIEELRALGAPRVVLMTAAANAGARAVFAKLGFRETMIEMTREIT